MSIRQRLTFSFAAMLILFALNLAVNFWSDTQRTDSFEKLQETRERQILAVDLERDLLARGQEAVGMDILADAETELEPSRLDEMVNRVQATAKRVQRLASLSKSTGEAADALRLEQIYLRLEQEWTRFYRGLADELTEAAAPPQAASGDDASSVSAGNGEDRLDAEEPAEADLELAKEWTEEALANVGRIQDLERARVLDANAQFFEVQEFTRRTTLWIFAISIFFALALAISVSTHLARSLRDIEIGAQKIGEGDLDHRIPVVSQDELAQLGSAFNHMAARLTVARESEEQARMAAESANRAKSTFLANMSHELRTPMNAIIGYGEMMVEDAEDMGHEELVPDLNKILAAGKHLLALINDILDLSKIEAGKMTLFLENIRVEDLIDDVTSTIEPLVVKNRNELKIEPSPDLGILVADETKVRQTLFNLLSNACKFTTEGIVTLRCRREPIGDEERFFFEVSDTGIGMTADQLERVFDEFTQADASTTRKFGGTGLGLSICKKFCRLMGGDIRAKSEEGVGSTFIVELPAVVDDSPEARTQEARRPAPDGIDARATIKIANPTEAG